MSKEFTVIFMFTIALEKFSFQVTPEILTVLRKIAESEGRPIQAVLDETVREYIERKEKGQPRHQVIDACAQSLSEFNQLYRELASFIFAVKLLLNLMTCPSSKSDPAHFCQRFKSDRFL